MSQGATLLHLRGAAGMDAIYRKISWRLLPLLMLCCAVAYLDRVNVDFVARHIGASLAFRDHVHSWGMAAFFIGYCMFAVPSNLLLEHLGTRKMLLRMMLGWAACSAASAFVRAPIEFYLIRFLLGVFEAGFFPGVILYLTWWFPSGRRARAIAVFAASTLAAVMLATPLSSAMLQALTPLDLFDGWQWLLLAQAAPPLVLGVFAWWYLDDRPGDAEWLSSFEQQMVAQDLARDEARRHGGSDKDVDMGDADAPSALAVLWGLLRDRTMVLLGAANLLLTGASFAIVHWSPALLQRWTASDPAQLALLSLVPGLAGIVGMLAIGYDSDRRRERRFRPPNFKANHPCVLSCLLQRWPPSWPPRLPAATPPLLPPPPPRSRWTRPWPIRTGSARPSNRPGGAGTAARSITSKSAPARRCATRSWATAAPPNRSMTSNWPTSTPPTRCTTASTRAPSCCATATCSSAI